MNALLLSVLFGVVMMFSGIVLKQKNAVRNVAVVAMIILLVANIMDKYGMHIFSYDVSSFMVFNDFTLFFNSIAILATILYLLVSSNEMQKVGNYYSDYFALLFFILCGIFLVTSFTSLLTLFLGIEIISIPLYILTGSDKKNLKSNEASLKYFLMGAFSTGILLLGIAFLYGAHGTFSIDKISLATSGHSNLQIAGMLLLLFAIAFKASVAPFHFWTPDVYDGAPTVFTSFMATIVKVAIFIGFIRLFNYTFMSMMPSWQLWIVVMIVLTLLIGNITAVFQQSVKRMLAYSSISQAGFMLFAIFALNQFAYEGLLIYAMAYSLATIGIFAVLAKMNDYTYAGFNGLAKHQPVLAFMLTIFLLSLAGIPLTAGFLAKFYMLKAAVATGKYLWLVIFGVIMAAVSVYYYFRVIQSMYFKEGPDRQIQISVTEKYTLAFICLLIILLGIFPGLLFNWLYF